MFEVADVILESMEENMTVTESQPVSGPEAAPVISSGQPPVSPKKTYNPLLFLVLAIIMVYLGLAGYFAIQNNLLKNRKTVTVTPPKPTSAPTVIPDDTSNWKTYDNSRNGFSFRYPSGWVLNENDQGGTIQTTTNNRIDFLVSADDSPTIAEYLVKTDKISETAYEGMPSMQVQSTRVTVINGLNCIQREEYLRAADLTRIITYFKKGQLVVSVSLVPTPGNGLMTDRPLYGQILTTFRFTDGIGVSQCGGWNTSGEIICECSGQISKSVCPAGAACDSGTYTCSGSCGKCCYTGIAENNKYPKCTDNFACPGQKTIDCTPCTGSKCPAYFPMYCSKGSAYYNWIKLNCPDVVIKGITE